ncbi:MAG TPA: ImmA/IrrE family metallo-endopeptidase [Candidatus Acidoferrales bacterium]|nr:ImmA/IrrE family metallo-endopeptidase [Candidatus Acidoferrales bacterium]
MLNAILEATGVDAQTCARLLGISPTVFGEWTAEQRNIPESYALLLADVLGVDPAVIRMSSKQAHRAGDLTPAIWYKFRGDELIDADRECVLLIRQLGHYQSEIEEVTGKKAVGWRPLFEAIRQGTDAQAAPSEQGRRAARMFRESTGLSQCATGIGEVFRGNLRRLGVLVIESPIPGSRVEGCCFYVGAHPMERPCVFANLYQSTWFRRNVVLLHEVAHAIFDAPSVAATLDFLESNGTADVSEQRAQSFALEALLPKEVLHNLAQSRGIKWDRMSPTEMAYLVADTHVEQRAVARAAVAAGFVPPEQEAALRSLDISGTLRSISERALTTAEYVGSQAPEVKQRQMLGKRTTTIPSRTIRLPIPYVRNVIEALRDQVISRGRAAELLMIDDHELDSRFRELVSASVDE